MSLIHCPECGHEVASSALSCPNCAHPFAVPVDVVVPDRKEVVRVAPRQGGFPTWALIPIGLLVMVLIGIMYMISGSDNGTNVNVNADLARSRTANGRTSTTVEPETVTMPGSTTTVPPSSVTVEPPPPPPVSRTEVPGSQSTVSQPAAPTKGKVSIEAKVITSSGSQQVVRNEKFYLLDEDVESILSRAGVDPIEGQSLTASLGMALLYPSQYGAFNSKAMTAIRRHVKYSGQTDSSGKAAVMDVDPDSYYLFGLTKSGRGFAIWNSPVTINVGDNLLTLSPPRVTEIRTPTGE